MEDLGKVVDWIELGNKTLFNPLDTKATLYLFENRYKEVEYPSGFEQKRRCFPMEAAVFESFPDLFKQLVQFIKMKQLSGNSEIRFGLVFKPFDLNKKRKLMDRIRSVMALNKSSFSQPNGAKELIFSVDLDDDSSPSMLNEPPSDSIF